jgi:hypothetical protein
MGDPTDGERDADDGPDGVRVWLVERTYSDDEQNLIVLTYATTDGERYFRKERALTAFSDHRDTTAAVTVEPHNLGEASDEERAWYAEAASRTAAEHAPDDVV